MANKKKVEIEMTNGTKKLLVDLTPADLPNVKMTMKKDGDGKDTPNMTMKTEIVKETKTHYTERRLYKWTTMPTLVMYDLNVPKTYDVWTKESTPENRYDYGIGNWKIEQDKLHNGVTTSKVPGDQKIMNEAAKLGLPPEVIAKIQAELIKAGFGK